ncbi:MAG: SRPBCC domain-containing protein [Dyadobacter sp.]|uniref:SRPBCC family protein n=1 Tax=Dyadobacter sp. TaxID=1914288 RepID=UPI003265B557
MTNNFVFESDLAARTIRIVREFNAPVEKVWKAFTDPDLLEKWFAPKPWKVETKRMDFTVGGVWLYAMVSPEGQKHWTQYEFTAIENCIAYSTTGMFADEDGNTGAGAPKTYRNVTFLSIGSDRSKVETVITFTDEATIQMFVEGGFKNGTAVTLNQLDELLVLE